MKVPFAKFSLPGAPRAGTLRMVIVVAGVFVSVLAAITVMTIDDSRRSVEAAQSVERRLSAVATSINEIKLTVQALAAHVSAMGHFDREAAERYAARTPIPGALAALAFAQVVPESERSRVEAELTARGVANGLHDRTTSEGIVPAAARPYHLVVTLLTAGDNGDLAEGMDLMSDPASRDAIAFAVAEDEVAASAAFRTQAQDDSTRFAIYAPVYRNGVGDGLDDVIGIAAAVVNLDSVLLPPFTTRSRITAISDLSDDGRVIYTRGSDLPAVANTVERSFSAANRTWQVRLVTVADRYVLLAPAATLIGGLVLTLLALTLVERSYFRRRASQVDAEFAEALERLGVSEETYQVLFGNLAVGIAQTDAATGRFVAVNDRLCEMLGYERDELLALTTWDVADDAPVGMERRDASDASPGPGGLVGERRYRRKDGSMFWGLASVSETRIARRGTQVVTKVVQDVTQAKDAEASLRVLVRELAHRVRNTTQIISSLADQTRLQATDVDDYHARFIGRLRALTSAQDALYERSWGRVEASEVIRRTLAPFAARDMRRLVCNVDRIELSAQEAQTLALTVHELGANATRYGAWSAPDGEVQLTVRRLPSETNENAECDMDLTWRERNGPAVAQPSRRGFGSVMLGRILPAQHDGSSELSYEPEGFAFHARLAIRRHEEEDDDDEREALKHLLTSPEAPWAGAGARDC